MSSVVEINDLQRLDDLRQDWRALLSQTPGASFFHSLEWLEVYWRHFAADQRLRVIVISEGGQPVGILPLVVRSERHKLGKVRALTYPLHDWGTFYGPVGLDPAATLREGLRHIGDTRRDWDLIDLKWIDQQSDQGQTAQAMEAVGFRSRTALMDHVSLLDFDGDWETYWMSHKADWRSSVRRREKKLAAMGPVEFVRHRPRGSSFGEDDPRWDLYEACEHLAAKSWQAGSTTGTTLSHDKVRDFFRDTHQAATKFGASDTSILSVGGRPVAFAYGYHYQGDVFGSRLGYDPEFASYGVGTLIKCRLMQDCFARGDRLFDLGAGYADLKQEWRTRVEGVYRCSFFPINWRAQAVRLRRYAKGLMAKPTTEAALACPLASAVTSKNNGKVHASENGASHSIKDQPGPKPR